MGTQYFKRTTEADRERIMKLHEEGLNYQVIARRTGFAARSVARIVQREKSRQGEKLVKRGKQ